MMQPKHMQGVVDADETMNAEEMRAAFNEWMRRYTEEPERFQAEFKSVALFLAQSLNGEEPTYGQVSTAFMFEIRADLNVAVG